MKISKHTYLLFFFLLVSVGLMIFGFLHTSFQSVFLWRSLLLNTIYFTSIALFGTLFFSMHMVAGAKWIHKIQSILLTMGEALLLLLAFYLVLIIGLENNFDWVQNESEKDWYLNIPFFVIRNVITLGVYSVLCFIISKKAINLENSKVLPAAFMMFFGVTILFFCYDWIVSLDQHWYSTLFGWYLFAGLLVAGLSVAIVLIVIFEKSLNLQNDKKVYQNLARYLFAFSMMWAYLWYVQYLLVWYTNKPEEVVFFGSRIDSFPIVFYMGFILSFVVPFVLLLANFARKNKPIILIAAISGIAGQWLDKAFYIFPEIDEGISSLLFIAVGVFVFESFLFWIIFKLRLRKK